MSYAIGLARPFSVLVEAFGTARIAEDRLSEIVLATFDLRPQAIIDRLGLRRPIYAATSAYGHFGRDEFPWEATDRVDQLRAAAG